MQKAEVRGQKAISRRQKETDSGQSSDWRRVAKTRFLPPVSRLLLSALLLTAHCTLPTALHAQEVVDKMVATVNAGGLTECGGVCLITYSDLLWQLALQPDTPLDNPTSTDLNRSLRLVIDQRLILQEAEKLPSIAPTADEIKVARDELVKELCFAF